eukprot:645271_1
MPSSHMMTAITRIQQKNKKCALCIHYSNYNSSSIYKNIIVHRITNPHHFRFYVTERKKQLVAYLSTLHRYPDVLLCDVHCVSIGDSTCLSAQLNIIIRINTIKCRRRRSCPLHHQTNTTKMNPFHAHPILPSPHHLKHNHQQQHSKEASPASTADPDLSIPMTMNDPFSDYYYDEEEVMVRSLRPRRGSDCGIRSSCHTEEKKKISVMKGNEIGDILDALEESRSDSAAAADDSSKKELEEKQMDPLERFGIEHYEHITPSLIRVLEAFLDLEKRSTFGSSLTLAATSMMSWFFNGYIANKLYASSAASLSMDGTLSYLVQWVSDLLWIPPTYTMNEEEAAIPTQEEMDALRVEARQCLQQMFEEYVGDNVPKIIGQRKQLERCMMKFWRFMQQDKLLKHLAFSVLDALLQDLFVDKVSRRYQRRAWIADRKRKREEKQKKREHKHQPQKHNKQAKIDEEDVVVMQQQQQQKVVELRRPQPIPLPTKKKKKKKEKKETTPNIDLFSGGSLLSDYTKKFMKKGIKKMQSSDDDDDDDEDESTAESEEQSDAKDEQEGYKCYSDDDKQKKELQNGGCFLKGLRTNQSNLTERIIILQQNMHTIHKRKRLEDLICYITLFGLSY